MMIYKKLLDCILKIISIAIFTGALSSCDKKSTTKINQESEVITVVAKIEPQFKYASKFYDNVASVCVGNDNCKWGYIDRGGKFVINPKFSTAGNFENGYAYVEFKKDGLPIKAIINKKNELSQIDSTSKFDSQLYEGGGTDNDISEGLVAFAQLVDGKTKIGFVDITGKVKIQPLYADVQKYSEGVASVQVGGKNGKWGFIDKNGKMLIEPQFEYINKFSEGMAHIRIGSYEDGSNGFINTTGKVVISPKFKNVKEFNEGLAAVEIVKDGVKKWGFINKSGEFAIDAIYDFDINDFDLDLAFYFDRTMLFSNGLAAVQFPGKKENQWGYINKSGEMVIEPQFSRAKGFSDGLAAVRIGSAENGKWGFIDTKGKFVVNPIYDDVHPFREKMAAIQSGKGKDAVWGFLEKK